jgi:hypothetical protein
MWKVAAIVSLLSMAGCASYSSELLDASRQCFGQLSAATSNSVLSDKLVPAGGSPTISHLADTSKATDEQIEAIKAFYPVLQQM